MQFQGNELKLLPLHLPRRWMAKVESLARLTCSRANMASPPPPFSHLFIFKCSWRNWKTFHSFYVSQCSAFSSVSWQGKLLKRSWRIQKGKKKKIENLDAHTHASTPPATPTAALATCVAQRPQLYNGSYTLYAARCSFWVLKLHNLTAIKFKLTPRSAKAAAFCSLRVCFMLPQKVKGQEGDSARIHSNMKNENKS